MEIVDFMSCVLEVLCFALTSRFKIPLSVIGSIVSVIMLYRNKSVRRNFSLSPHDMLLVLMVAYLF